MIHRLIIIISVNLLSLCTSAQDIKTVDVEYIYIAPESMSPMVAKRVALERAQQKAIEDNFPTTHKRTNITFIDQKNESSNVSFKSYSTSNLCGEWISTTQEPIYNIENKDGMQIVTISLSGKIRKIPESRATIEVVLCNNIHNPYHTTTFHHDESIFLKYRSSQDGYVLVFLEGEDGNAIRLLPFAADDGICYKTKKDHEYTFFVDKSEAPNKEFTGGEPLKLTASHDGEMNILTLIHSPTPIKKPIYDPLYGTPFEYVTNKRFQKWISESKISNPEITVIQTPIIINL